MPCIYVACICHSHNWYPAQRDICRYDMLTNFSKSVCCPACFHICRLSCWCTEIFDYSQDNSGWKNSQEVSGTVPDTKQGQLWCQTRLFRASSRWALKNSKDADCTSFLKKPFANIFIGSLIREKKEKKKPQKRNPKNKKTTLLCLYPGKISRGKKFLTKWTRHLFTLLLLKTSISITLSFCLPSSCADVSSITYKMLHEMIHDMRHA